MGQLTRQVFGRWEGGRAICNCLHGVELLFSEDMAAAFARALNDWIAKEWLDRDTRLRALIVVPTENIELAVDGIERCANDRRVVPVLFLGLHGKPPLRPHLLPRLPRTHP